MKKSLVALFGAAVLVGVTSVGCMQHRGNATADEGSGDSYSSTFTGGSEPYCETDSPPSNKPADKAAVTRTDAGESFSGGTQNTDANGSSTDATASNEPSGSDTNATGTDSGTSADKGDSAPSTDSSADSGTATEQPAETAPSADANAESSAGASAESEIIGND